MRRFAIRLVPILIAVLVVAFQTCSSETAVNEAGRKARYALAPQQEETLGLQSYQQVLNQSRVIESGPEYQLVRNCALRLARATETDFKWAVTLVQDPQRNAFCLPGGKIVVYTGILPAAQTEAGLATVMGHEMAHATLRHGSERLLKQKTTQTLMTGVQVSVGDMNYDQQRMILGAIGAGAKFGVLLPFGREHESEADAIGLRYMAKAGYDPREAIGFWQRMAKMSEGGSPPEFMSTHPSHGTRIEQIKSLIPQVMPLYEQAKAQRN